MRRGRRSTAATTTAVAASAAFVLLGLVGCSSAQPPTVVAPQTTKPRITNASDARERIDQLQRRGVCLDLQSAYLELKSDAVTLGTAPTKADIDRLRSQIVVVRGQVPELAKEDFEIVAKVYGDVAAAYDGVDLADQGATQRATAKARDALKEVDAADAKQADQAIQAYVAACLSQQH